MQFIWNAKTKVKSLFFFALHIAQLLGKGFAEHLHSPFLKGGCVLGLPVAQVQLELDGLELDLALGVVAVNRHLDYVSKGTHRLVQHNTEIRCLCLQGETLSNVLIQIHQYLLFLGQFKLIRADNNHLVIPAQPAALTILGYPAVVKNLTTVVQQLTVNSQSVTCLNY